MTAREPITRLWPGLFGPTWYISWCVMVYLILCGQVFILLCKRFGSDLRSNVTYRRRSPIGAIELMLCGDSKDGLSPIFVGSSPLLSTFSLFWHSRNMSYIIIHYEWLHIIILNVFAHLDVGVRRHAVHNILSICFHASVTHSDRTFGFGFHEPLCNALWSNLGCHVGCSSWWTCSRWGKAESGGPYFLCFFFPV